MHVPDMKPYQGPIASLIVWTMDQIVALRGTMIMQSYLPSDSMEIYSLLHKHVTATNVILPAAGDIVGLESVWSLTAPVTSYL